LPSVKLIGQWSASDSKLIYTFSPYIDPTSLLSSANSFVSISVVEPSQGITLPPAFSTPFSDCFKSTSSDSTVCEVLLNIPSDTSIHSVQVRLEVTQEERFESAILSTQEIYLDKPITHFHNTAIDSFSSQGGSSMQYTVLGSTIIGLSFGIPNLLTFLKLMSFVEVLLYFDVEYPSCVEKMFKMFKDSSRVSYVSSLILGPAAYDNVCRLGRVFVKRGHTTCSIVGRQLMFFVLISTLLMIKAGSWFATLKLRQSTSKLKNIFQKVNNKLNLEYFYNYLDAYFFVITLESIISLTSKQNSYYNFNQGLFMADKLFAFLTLIVCGIMITIGTAFVYLKNRNPSREPESEPPSALLVKPSEPSMNSPRKSIWDNLEFILNKLVRQDKFHGEYIIPGIQIKSLLCAIALTTLTKFSLLTIVLATVLQGGVVYLSFSRSNFKQRREWAISLITHSCLLVCSILGFIIRLDVIESPLSLYYGVGFPIVFIIALIFLANLINLIYTTILKLLNYFKSRSLNKVGLNSPDKPQLINSDSKMNTTEKQLPIAPPFSPTFTKSKQTPLVFSKRKVVLVTSPKMRERTITPNASNWRILQSPTMSGLNLKETGEADIQAFNLEEQNNSRLQNEKNEVKSEEFLIRSEQL